MKHVVIENAASWILSNFAWFSFGVAVVTVETWLKIGAACAAIIASIFSILASRATIRKHARKLPDGEDKEKDE